MRKRHLLFSYTVVLLMLFDLRPSSATTTGDVRQTTDQRVATLIQRMLNKKTEQGAFTDLEALGCEAVPEIIRQMDDRRDLPDPRKSLRNKSPDAFEGLRHYGPRKIVDALAAILNQITGRDFGFISNGATEPERRKAVQGWRDFLRQTPPEKLCVGG